MDADEAPTLSPEERAEIAEELLPSVNFAREDIESAWTAEVQRRIAQADAGEIVGTDWRTVLDRVRSKVLGH